MGYTDVILSQPPKGTWISCKEIVGHRLVFLGTHSIEEQPDNMNPGKTRQVATVDYVDLDDGAGGIIQWGAMVDKPGIVNKLRNQRTAIMGRLVFGEAKVGQSPPYILADHEPQDAEYFLRTWMPANREALAGRSAQRPQSAGTQSVGAQPAPAGQPVAAPQYQQPAPVAAAAAAPFGQVPASFGQAPAPVAAPLANGQTEPYSPEAIAAIQRMVAAGQLPAFPIPGQ